MFFFSSRRRHTRCALVTGVQTCALPISPLIVTPLGNDAIIRRRIPSARIEVGDWGDHFEIAPGARAYIVPALHWSSRGPRDRRMALWGGFMLEAAGKRVYFAGDTGYGERKRTRLNSSH